LAPFVTYLVMALVVIIVLRRLLHVVGFAKVFSHASIAELSLYVTILGLLMLLFWRRWPWIRSFTMRLFSKTRSRQRPRALRRVPVTHQLAKPAIFDDIARKVSEGYPDKKPIVSSSGKSMARRRSGASLLSQGLYGATTAVSRTTRVQ